jgi:hypothetical protein
LLVAGLDDYRTGKWESARKRLGEANRSSYVRDVARAALGDPNAISDILKTCGSPSDSKFCARCEHSGIYCCGPEAVGRKPGTAGRKTAGSEGCGDWAG